MTAAHVAIGPERELRDLYGRSKTLALAAAAALMLESSTDELAEEAERLVADCLEARRRATNLEPQLAACVDAAQRLHRLLDGAAQGKTTDADLEQARASYRRLRRQVWRVLPCEYVPCCASEHGHAER